MKIVQSAGFNHIAKLIVVLDGAVGVEHDDYRVARVSDFDNHFAEVVQKSLAWIATFATLCQGGIGIPKIFSFSMICAA